MQTDDKKDETKTFRCCFCLSCAVVENRKQSCAANQCFLKIALLDFRNKFRTCLAFHVIVLFQTSLCSRGYKNAKQVEIKIAFCFLFLVVRLRRALAKDRTLESRYNVHQEGSKNVPCIRTENFSLHEIGTWE